jgi:hypothetical protein
MERVIFNLTQACITISLNLLFFVKISITQKYRKTEFRSLLLIHTAKLFNSLHLFFTPALVGVLHFIGLNCLKTLFSSIPHSSAESLFFSFAKPKSSFNLVFKLHPNGRTCPIHIIEFRSEKLF